MIGTAVLLKTAVPRRDGETKAAQLGQPGDHLVGQQFIVTVDVLGQRRDFGGGKAADGRLQFAVFVVQAIGADAVGLVDENGRFRQFLRSQPGLQKSVYCRVWGGNGRQTKRRFPKSSLLLRLPRRLRRKMQRQRLNQTNCRAVTSLIGGVRQQLLCCQHLRR